MGDTGFLSDASSRDDERPIVTEPSRLGTAGTADTVGIAAGWHWFRH